MLYGYNQHGIINQHNHKVVVGIENVDANTLMSSDPAKTTAEKMATSHVCQASII